MTASDFDSAIRELVLTSLVVPDQVKNEDGTVSTRYYLMSLTQGFAEFKLNENPSLKAQIQERIQQVEYQLEQATKAKAHYRDSVFHLGATTEEEKVAAVVSQSAYHQWQAGHYYEAINLFKRAVDIAPRFSPIYRNWAIVEASEGHYNRADELMKKATQLDPQNYTHWVTWGNLHRKLNRTSSAYQLLKKAYDLAPEDPVVLNSLAWVQCYLGLYEEADKYFRKAIGDGELGRQQLLNIYGLAENLRRWAEYLKKDRRTKEALDKITAAYDLATKAIKIDPNDTKSQNLYKRICIDFGNLMYFEYHDPDKAITLLQEAIVEKPTRAKEKELTCAAYYFIAQILWKEKRNDEARAMCLKGLARPSKFQPKLKNLLQKLERTFGKITYFSKKRRYGFIYSDDVPWRIYFSVGDFHSYLHEETQNNLVGELVSFNLLQTSKGYRASDIRFESVNKQSK